MEPKEPEAALARPGLEGVIAGDTDIACVDQGRLLYRGYDISELAEKAGYEEVAHLLLYGALPNKAQLAAFRDTLTRSHGLPKEVVQTIRSTPREVPMMDVLRTAISMAGHFDPVADNDLDALRCRAVWLIAICSDVVAARFRLLMSKEPVAAKSGLSHAAQLLYTCHGSDPDEQSARVLDLTLVLYAEHEFNASTFTCRVITSTASDMVSAVVGAIGALKGPLHGGANEQAIKLINRFKSGKEARGWAENALATKQKIMGFGHRVYKQGDHRAHILEQDMRRLAEKKGRKDLVEIYDAIKDVMVNKAKPIYPNVDFPCGLTYYLLGLPPDLYTPLFVCSRVAGWCAHYIEQSQNNRLFRPLSRYVGQPLRPVPALAER